MIGINNVEIRKVQQQCYKTAKEHGFHEDEVNVDQKLLLTVGELIEAQNEIRSGHIPQEVYFHGGTSVREGIRPLPCHLVEAGAKPEGFGIELADAVIRIFDLAEALGIDLQTQIELKMNYNEGRPYKHGKKF